MDSKDSSINFFVFIFFISMSALLYVLINFENPALFESFSLAKHLGLTSNQSKFEFDLKQNQNLNAYQPEKNLLRRRYSVEQDIPLAVDSNYKYKLYSNGMAFYNNNKTIKYFNLSGELAWSFNSADKIISYVGRTENYLVFYFDNQTLVFLNLKSGLPEKRIFLEASFTHPINLIDQSVFYFKKIKNAITLKTIDLQTKTHKDLYSFSPIDQPLKTTVHSDFFIVYQPNKVFVFSRKDQSILIQWPLESPLASLGIYKNRLYMALSNLDLIAINLSSGEELWKSQSRYVGFGPLGIDSANRKIFLYAENGYLQVFDLANGKSKWRLNSFNETDLKETEILAVSSSSFAGLESTRVFKNIILSPCGNNKFCLINPIDGIIVGRIRFGEETPKSLPYIQERGLYFLGEQNGNYKLLKMLSKSPQRRQVLRNQEENSNPTLEN